MTTEQRVIESGIIDYYSQEFCPCGYQATEIDEDYCLDHKECFNCEGDGCNQCFGDGWI